MAMETIPCQVKVLGNTVKIIPEDGEIADNSQYEIRFYDFKSKDGKATLPESFKFKVVTEMTPSYCTISDVAALVDIYNVPESTILYYIREASKYADYIMNTSSSSGDTQKVTFQMKEFVKTKTMIDCLLKAYVNKAAGSGIKGRLGEISFEDTEKYATSINDLLDRLFDNLKGWEDALKGYEREGRAAPVYVVRASETSENTSFTEIANDITRDLPAI